MRAVSHRSALVAVATLLAACSLDHPGAVDLDAASVDSRGDTGHDAIVVAVPDAAVLDEEIAAASDAPDDVTVTPDDAGTSGDVVVAPADAPAPLPPDTNTGTVPSDHTSLPTHGGDYGTAFSFVCDRPGEIAVGLWGSEGSDTFWVDQVNRLGSVCAALHGDGALTGVRTTATAGDAIGTMFTDVCPAGQVLVGINGHAGGVLDGIQGVCAHLGAWLVNGTEGTTLSGRGGTGGTAYRDRCGAGYVASGLTGKAGPVVARTRVTLAQLQCVRVRP